MKKNHLPLVLILLLPGVYSCKHREDITQYAPVEVYPNDTILQTIAEKRAMIVVAHDDDMCAMSGTISLLNREGWEIAIVSFSKTPERNAAQVKACKHILISQMVMDLASGRRISPVYIYQNVYTNHMERTIKARHSKRMKSWGFPGDERDHAQKIYHQVNGMPEPTVQIRITSEAQSKMDYLRSYNERERKTIGFFIPAFEEYSAEEYFTIFDREFFRIIKIGQPGVLKKVWTRRSIVYSGFALAKPLGGTEWRNNG